MNQGPVFLVITERQSCLPGVPLMTLKNLGIWLFTSSRANSLYLKGCKATHGVGVLLHHGLGVFPGTPVSETPGF